MHLFFIGGLNCAVVGGRCSAACSRAANHFRCPNSSHGCCLPKKDVCADVRGVCLSINECVSHPGYEATGLACPRWILLHPTREASSSRKHRRWSPQTRISRWSLTWSSWLWWSVVLLSGRSSTMRYLTIHIPYPIECLCCVQIVVAFSKHGVTSGAFKCCPLANTGPVGGG